MKKNTVIIFLLVIFLATTACSGTFKGKVIDADTKPIEGAVVVAVWHEEQATPTGSTSRLMDVAEALTDKNGDWMIKGPRGRDMGNITAIFTFLTGTYITNPPHFIIFKPGYCSWPKGFEIKACKMKLSDIGVGDTIELRRLINKEDRLRSSAIWPSLMESDKESLKKVKIFLKLLDEENRSLGLSEDPRLKEFENEK